jgi:hypothetical protein
MNSSSVYLRDLNLSMVPPLGWDGVLEEERFVRLYGPALDSNFNHRPTISIRYENNFNEELEKIWSDSKGKIQDSYPLFSLLKEQNINLNNELIGVIMEFSWFSEELSQHFWGLQALIASNTGDCYLINGSVELTNFTAVKTTFFEIINTIRLVKI